jgi:alpha-tubulin suppressor-like RCC1 family protein
MTICSKQGVWSLDETYKKVLNNQWQLNDTDSSAGGELWGWGTNGNSRNLQNVTDFRVSSPVQLPGTRWAQNSNGSLARKDDGSLWVWGDLKNCKTVACGGGRASDVLPLQIPGNWSNVFPSDRFRTHHASKEPGTLFTWAEGMNVGDGVVSENTRLVGDLANPPFQHGGNQWAEAAAGVTELNLARKTDNTLWAWGFVQQGQLGINVGGAPGYRSSPTQIPGTAWVSIAAGNTHAAAIKSNGTLWVWGSGTYGRLGTNDTITRSSPIQVPGTQWKSVNATSCGLAAIKTDNTLWTWGLNNHGQLGDGTLINRSSPIQVPGTQWKSVHGITGSNQHAIGAIKTDNTLWTWGRNHYGQLGHNNLINRSSPVQVPGTKWNIMCGGVTQTVFARKFT